jgi:hypothetical protein
MAPYSQMPVPMSVFQCLDSFYFGLFIRDFLMHHYGL